MHAFMQHNEMGGATFPLSNICNANPKHSQLENHTFWYLYAQTFEPKYLLVIWIR